MSPDDGRGCRRARTELVGSVALGLHRLRSPVIDPYSREEVRDSPILPDDRLNDHSHFDRATSAARPKEGATIIHGIARQLGDWNDRRAAIVDETESCQGTVAPRRW